MCLDPTPGQERAGFAAVLHARRRAAGLTQAELAGRAGVGVRTVRDLERGRAARPQRTTVELLAAGLGLAGRERDEFIAFARGATTMPLPPPVQLIGRDREVADIADLLVAGETLVTLVGLAGVGKSSLALAVAHRVTDKFPGGVAGIVIGEATSEADLLAAVFRVGVADELGSRFGAGPGVLLLDAADRAPGPVAAALHWLARVVPALRVLATGRRPIGLAGERTWPVLPLEVPPPGTLSDSALDGLPERTDLESVQAYPAARLFLARLRPVRREPLDEREVEALVTLVRRLGGLPLALELAAGWGRVLDLNQILHRYGDRVLDLSAVPDGEAGPGSGTDLQARPGMLTVRDAVAASYQLLGPAERYALRMLSVFCNRWSVELAEAMLAETSPATAAEIGAAGTAGPEGIDLVPVLDRLIALGLVGVRGTGPYRFRLLDMVRDFAQEQAAAVGDLRVARCRHARIFAQLATQISPDLVGGNLPRAVAQLDDMAGDLRAALNYAAAENPHTALRLAAMLPRWWRFRGRDVAGRQWLRQLLEDPRTADAEPALRAWANLGVAQLAHEHGAGPQELIAAEQALAEFERLGEVSGELAAHSLLAAVWMAAGRYDQARRHSDAVLSLARQTSRVRDMAMAQISLSRHEVRDGDLAAASRRLAAADRLASQCGEPRLKALARADLAEVARLDGRYDEAVSCGRRAAALLQVIGDLGQWRRALTTVGLALAQAGRMDEAGVVLAQALLSGAGGFPPPNLD